MTLSIITVNLNNRDGLQRTIDSVVSQTFTDYEWIVIDGGSTDGSRELIEQYADHFAYWCSEPDKGIYNAMNKGIAHAKGDWLQFLNSGDCLYEKNTLEKVFAKEHEADVIYGNAIMDDNKTLFIYPSRLSLSYITKHNISHQASFYKITLFKDKMYDEQFKVIADYVLIIEFAISGKIFKYVDQILVTIENNGISTSHIGDEETKTVKYYIPTIIRNDLDTIENIDNKQYFINSHKSLRLINNFNTKIINILGRLIKKIENRI